MTDDAIALSETDEVDVATAVLDLTAVDQSRLPLVRARLWRLRRSTWGWKGLQGTAARVASEEPRAAFWLMVEHEGDDVAVLAALDGKLTTVKPAALTSLAAKRLARSAEEAERVLEVLDSGGRDPVTPLRQREREVVDGKLVDPLWPDTEILKKGELVSGTPFKSVRVEGYYYMPESLRQDIADFSRRHDVSLSYTVQASYLKARDRIQNAKSWSELPDAQDDPVRKARVFLVLPSWMALEVERRGHELDLSTWSIIRAAVLLGLPELMNEK